MRSGRWSRWSSFRCSREHATRPVWLEISGCTSWLGPTNRSRGCPLSEELYERAIAAAERAYAPYSNYRVGAAVRARDGRIFEGVNVENAAYPLGVCAEKVAISSAVVAGCRPGDLEAIGITASPCGGCRQWLYEFRLDRVTFRNRDGDLVSYTPAELLPDTWDLD